MQLYVRITLFLFAFAKAYSQESPATATTDSILYNHPASLVVKHFFEDFHAQDTVALKEYFDDKAILHSLSIKEEKREVSTSTVEEFLNGIAKIPATVAFKEQLTSLEIIAGNDIATIHTDYKFLINERLSHVGRNVFTLISVGNEWKIIQLADTRLY